MNATRLLRNAATFAFAAGILALGATDAHASHFRYGTIKWHVTAQTATTFNLEVSAECAWRRSFYTPQPNVGTLQATGQTLQLIGNGYSNSTPLNVNVTAINGLPEDWFVGNNTFVFNGIPLTALNGAGMRIFWNGNARIGTLLDGNADDFFNVEARMNNNLTNLFGPVSSLLPIVNIAHGQPAAQFQLPASDPEGDALTFTISSTARSSLTKAAPDGADDLPPATLSINSTTGLVTWDTASELPPSAGQELYAVQFVVTDSKGGEAPIDALFRLVPNTSQPPRAFINDIASPATFSVHPGQPVTFVFKGVDQDAGDHVHLAVGGGMPVGATFTPGLPFSGSSPQSSTFNWTPTLANVGSHVISLSVTDDFAMQDTTSATITVLPNLQPAVTCPVDANMEATGPTTPYSAVAIVDDPEDEAMTVKWFVDNVLELTTNVPATSGATTITFPFGYTVAAHPLRVEVNDGITNTVMCNATITVVDTTPPDIDIPASQIKEATGPAGAVAVWSPDPPTATDIVDGPRPVTCSHASGDTFPILPPPPPNTTTVVTCTSIDLHNNMATETFTITVQDTTPPTVNVPTVPPTEATGPNGAIVNYPPATATDLVDGAITPSCNPASGSTFPVGNTTVNCTATDVHGNQGSNSFVVSVVDTTGPTVTVPGPFLVEATGPGGANVDFIPAPTAFDLVDGNITPTCVPASGSLFPLLPPPPATTTTTVTCTAVDSHNNPGSATFTVTIKDTTPPTISNVPADITVPSNLPGGGANVNYTLPTAFDIVDLVVPVTCVPPPGGFFPVGTTTVLCSASDVRHNTSTATFHVTVLAPPPVPCVTMGPVELWPPNHKMRDISVQAIVPGQPGAVCNITSVTSTEPVTGRTYGDFAPDWIFSNLNLQLRAERYDKPGRTYGITVTCTANGQTASVLARVLVPHDQSPHDVPPIVTCQ